MKTTLKITRKEIYDKTKIIWIDGPDDEYELTGFEDVSYIDEAVALWIG